MPLTFAEWEVSLSILQAINRVCVSLSLCVCLCVCVCVCVCIIKRRHAHRADIMSDDELKVKRKRIETFVTNVCRPVRARRHFCILQVLWRYELIFKSVLGAIEPTFNPHSSVRHQKSFVQVSLDI